MSAIATTQEDSDLQRVLDSAIKQNNPYVYFIKSSQAYTAPHPPARRSKTVAASSTVEFDVPKSGVWDNLYLTFSYGTSASLITNAYAVLQDIEYVELRTSSSLIQRLTPRMIKQHVIHDVSINERAFNSIQDMTGSAQVAAATTAFTRTFPIPFSHFMRDHNKLNTRITEPLIVRVLRKAGTAVRETATYGSIGIEAEFHFSTLAPSLQAGVEAGLRSKGEGGVARLLTNSVDQVFTDVNSHRPPAIGVSDTRFYDLDYKHPVTRLIFCYAKDDAVSRQAGEVMEGELLSNLGITDISLLSSGVPVQSWKPLMLKHSMVSKLHKGGGYDTTKSYFVIDFGKTEEKTYMQMGFRSLRNMTAPQLRVSFSPVAAGTRQNADFHLTYEYYVEETIEPADGVMKVITLS